MPLAFLPVVLLFGFGEAQPQTQQSGATTPVLLELFTSEGCSSCPPADKLLAQIDRQQPIPGARVVVLSEHVDYWNRQGWTDPYSSGEFTLRQQAYASRFGVEVYTPQLVVDGAKALVGSDWPKAANAIKEALREPTIPVQVAGTRNEDKGEVNIQVGPNSSDKKAIVFLALAHDHTESHVSGGENAGRDLSEVAVAYSLRQIAKIGPQSPFSRTLSDHTSIQLETRRYTRDRVRPQIRYDADHRG